MKITTNLADMEKFYKSALNNSTTYRLDTYVCVCSANVKCCRVVDYHHISHARYTLLSPSDM